MRGYLCAFARITFLLVEKVFSFCMQEVSRVDPDPWSSIRTFVFEKNKEGGSIPTHSLFV